MNPFPTFNRRRFTDLLTKAVRNEDSTLAAYFLLGLIGIGLAVHAKHESNPTHFTTDRLAAVSATRD